MSRRVEVLAFPNVQLLDVATSAMGSSLPTSVHLDFRLTHQWADEPRARWQRATDGRICDGFRTAGPLAELAWRPFLRWQAMDCRQADAAVEGWWSSSLRSRHHPAVFSAA